MPTLFYISATKLSFLYQFIPPSSREAGGKIWWIDSVAFEDRGEERTTWSCVCFHSCESYGGLYCIFFSNPYLHIHFLWINNCLVDQCFKTHQFRNRFFLILSPSSSAFSQIHMMDGFKLLKEDEAVPALPTFPPPHLQRPPLKLLSGSLWGLEVVWKPLPESIETSILSNRPILSRSHPWIKFWLYDVHPLTLSVLGILSFFEICFVSLRYYKMVSSQTDVCLLSVWKQFPATAGRDVIS